MIKTDLDRPPDKEIECRICGKPMTVSWHLFMGRWAHGNCHDQCVENLERSTPGSKRRRVVPERFMDFYLDRLPDLGAARKALNFDIDNAYRALAIIGVRGMGKSRLMWEVVKEFFAKPQLTSWVEYAIFPDLMTDFERATIIKLKAARYAFIDDIGSTESYGRERAQLQDVIRTRVQKQMWTFLTIDDPSFDAGFEDLFRDRAVVVYVK